MCNWGGLAGVIQGSALHLAWILRTTVSEGGQAKNPLKWLSVLRMAGLGVDLDNSQGGVSDSGVK